MWPRRVSDPTGLLGGGDHLQSKTMVITGTGQLGAWTLASLSLKASKVVWQSTRGPYLEKDARMREDYVRLHKFSYRFLKSACSNIVF